MRNIFPLSINLKIALLLIKSKAILNYVYLFIIKTTLVGSMTAAILLVVSFMLFQNSTPELKNYHKNLLTRTLVLFVVSFVCLVLPNSVLINHYYSNEPELKELYLKQQENPEDETIQKEIEEYHANRFNEN